MKHSIVVTHFKRLCRGSLVGFANIFIAELHLSVRDVAIHRSAGGNCWAQLPTKPLIDPDGTVKRTADGRVAYVSILNFADRAASDAFSAATVAALRRFDPSVFETAA